MPLTSLLVQVGWAIGQGPTQCWQRIGERVANFGWSGGQLEVIVKLGSVIGLRFRSHLHSLAVDYVEALPLLVQLTCG